MHLSSLGREAEPGRAFTHREGPVAAGTSLAVCLGKEEPSGLENKTSPRCHCRSDKQRQV